MSNNNVKMIKTDSETIELLSKIKGWHLLRVSGNNTSYADIVKNLVFKDAKRKGLVGEGNETHSSERD